MFKSKLTLMVIPDSKGVAKQISVSLGAIYSAVLLLILIVFASVYLAARFFTVQVDDAELTRLRAENEKLASNYERMRWDLAEVDSRYQDLVKKEVAIRTIFDLPEINTEERQLGIGGPIPKLVGIMSETEKFAYVTERQVDRLLRLSDFELEKYAEVEQDLGKLKDRLQHTPSIWPTQGWLSRGYGMQPDPFTGYRQLHRGVDIANRTGTRVVAPADGRVTQVGVMGNMGKVVTIDHGFGFITRYGHLSGVSVQVGSQVTRGQVIAAMGSTGYSTGPHLHYEVWRNGKSLNPMNYILNEM